MLLLITVSLIGLSYVWISSTFQATAEKTEKSIEKGTEIMSMDFEINSAWVDSNRNSLYISLQNTGTGDIKLSEVSVLVNGIDAGKSYADINPKGLVLYLPFDESSGSVAKDYSGNGNDGTLYVGAGDNPDNKWIDGMFGNALEFDGVNDYINIPDSPSLNIYGKTPITISLWMKKLGPSALSTGRGYSYPIIKSGGWSGNRISRYAILENNYNVICFQLSDVSLSFNQLCYTYLDGLIGNWLHILSSWDGNTMKIFINGVEVASQQYTGTIGDTSTYPLRISNWPYFNGIIDEVRIYNRALSEEEILALYGKGVLKENKKAILKVNIPAQISNPCGATVSVKYMGKEKTAQVVCA